MPTFTPVQLPPMYAVHDPYVQCLGLKMFDIDIGIIASRLLSCGLRCLFGGLSVCCASVVVRSPWSCWSLDWPGTG